MKLSIIAAVLGLSMASTIQAQEAPSRSPHSPVIQKWEYRLVDSDKSGEEAARAAGVTKEVKLEKRFTPESMKRLTEARVAQMNALGEEGWEFCGCLDKDNGTMVFRRPK